MSETFDAYHQWLGIPPKYQPPDHYRLLGVEQFEEDADVISDAAERQIAHVRRKSLSQHSSLSQRLLNELASAKACLTHPDKKKEYDVALRKRLQSTKQAAPAADAQNSSAKATNTRARQNPPSPVAAASTSILVECACGQRFLAEPYLVGSMVPCPVCGGQIFVSPPSLEPSPSTSTLWSSDFDALAQPSGDPLGNWQQASALQKRADADVFQQVSQFVGRAARNRTLRNLLGIALVIAICLAILVPVGFGVQWAYRTAKNSGLLTSSNEPQANSAQPYFPQPNGPQPQPNSPQPQPNSPQPQPNAFQANPPQPNIPFTIKSRHSTSIMAGTPIEIRARDRVPLPPTRPLRFQLQPGYPEGVTLDEATGVLNWTPNVPNTYSFIVNAITPDVGNTVLELTIHVQVRERHRNMQVVPPRPDIPRKSVRF